MGYDLGGWRIGRGAKKGRKVGRAQHSSGIGARQVLQNVQTVKPINPKKIPPEPKKKEFHFHKLAFFLPRRVRAQEAIGEIEKERILLKQKLDIRNSDYEQKAQVRFEF